jgi:uncharacterized protein
MKTSSFQKGEPRRKAGRLDPPKFFTRAATAALVWFFFTASPFLYGQQKVKADSSIAEALKNLAMPSDAKSLYDLGVFLESTQSHAEAVECYRKAAELGFAAAQNNLGFCYQEGATVPRNYAEAVKWYRKAAAQGFAAGQNNLGICYRDAIGVPQDFSQAAYWFKLAAEQGLATAQNNLGVRYYKGQGVQTNYVEAAKLYRKAAEKGLPDALVNLAICYTDGRGVPKDKVKAFIYFNTAAAQGDRFAAQAREYVQRQMTPQQIAEGQRDSYALIAGKSFELPE